MGDIHRLVLYLVFSLHVAKTTNSLLCGSEFADVQSRAAAAGIVLQAKVDTTFERKDNLRFNVSIEISKIIRGSIGADLLKSRPGESTERHVLGRINVGEFGPQDDAACLTERQSLIMGGQKFIFFLKPSQEPGYYTQSSLPVQSSKTVLRSIRKILCNGCVIPASIRHSNKLVQKTVAEGSRVRLRCRVKGAPTPLVIWMKDEKVLRRRKAMRIRNSKKSSVLRLRRVRLKDAGLYVCISRNIAGQARKEFYLTVTPAQNSEHSTTSSPSISSSSSSDSTTTLLSHILDTSSPSVQTTPSTELVRSTLNVPMSGHYYPCEEQTYCLNGGVCVYLPEFDAEHCRCPANYMGKRCEIRDIFTLLKEITSAESQTHQRRLYTIVGVVIILIIIIALLFLCCYKARRSRARKREEVTSREEIQINYSPIAIPTGGMDTVDARLPQRMNSTTQTEPIDLALFIPSYPYLNHVNRGRSVDVHSLPRPSPQRRGSPASGRPQAHSLEPRETRRGGELYLPSRNGSFKTRREPNRRDSPGDRGSPARSKDSSTVAPKLEQLEPVNEGFMNRSRESSRLPTPDSTAEFLGLDSPGINLDAISHGESKASMLSIDMYNSSQVISDVNVSELSDSETDLNSETTGLISDQDQTDLDEKLFSVPIMFNGLHVSPHNVKEEMNSAPVNGGIRVRLDRL